MANYKELDGFRVQTLATDPDNPSWVGSIFYNSTEGVFKTVKPGGVTAGTWASGGSLNTARRASAGVGTQNAAVVITGVTAAAPLTGGNDVELYNGTSWSTNPNNAPNLGFWGAAVGTQTATLFVYGVNPLGSPTGESNISSTFNGTSFSPITGYNTARYAQVGFGTQTAGLIASGKSLPSENAQTELWNGTSWTEVNDVNTARYAAASSNTSPQTDGIICGGTPAPTASSVESWNGTSWTETTELNTPRDSAAGFGTSSSSLITTGGGPAPLKANTEFWNGTTWTELADLATARNSLSGGGTTTTGLVFGGSTTVDVANTEEWTAPDVVINTLTTS